MTGCRDVGATRPRTDHSATGHRASLKGATVCLALAELTPTHAVAGTRIALRRADSSANREISGRVVSLPFL